MPNPGRGKAKSGKYRGTEQGAKREGPRTSEAPNAGRPKGYVRPDPLCAVWSEEENDWINPLTGKLASGAERTGRSDAGVGRCCHTKGWGTGHKGVGLCKLHGGSQPGHMVKGMRHIAVERAKVYGDPTKPIDPDQALIQEIWRTNAHIEWLSQQIGDLDNLGDLTQATPGGYKKSVVVELYHQERAHLLNCTRAALTLGLQERQIQIVEEQGKLVAMAFQALMNDPRLQLTPEQRMNMPTLVREHLLALQPVTKPIGELDAGE